MNSFEWNNFLNPPREYRPMARWWWPGLDVEEETLDLQLEDLKEGGFAGAEIQAFLRGDTHFNPDDGEQSSRVHRYGTQYYFELVGRLMEKARSLGLLLEPTAGSGYPMGDTCVDPKQDGMQAFLVGCTAVAGGGGIQQMELASSDASFDTVMGVDRTSSYMSGKMTVWTMDYPRMRRDMKLIRVTAAKSATAGGMFTRYPSTSVIIETQSARDITGYVIDGKLEYVFPEGNWYVFAVYSGPSYQHVKTDSKINAHRESYVVNHFASGRIAPYLDRHIGRGKWDGFTRYPFRAFFVDSFELVGPYFWSEAFLTEFRNRRGYDLAPYLPILMVREDTVDENGRAIACFDLSDGESERIRRDYDNTIAELFVDYFMKEMEDWARQHSVKSRVQCYGHVMDNLRAFGRVDIPETEQLASAGVLDFLKLPASSALLYGKALATAEAFVWVYCDYMESPLRFKTASDKLTLAGIGQLYYHGMPYLSSRYDWPGYFPWHNSFGSFVNRNSLIWPWISYINRAIARNQYFVQQGKPVIDVCIYTGTLRHEFPYINPEFREDLSDGELQGIDRREQFNSIRFSNRCDRWQFMAADARRVALRIVEDGYDYCHINRECLAAAKLVDDRLVVGEASFKALIIPPSDFIDSNAVEDIGHLIDRGFPVFFVDKKPSESMGFYNYRENDRKIQECFSNIKPVSKGSLADALKRMDVMPGVDFQGEVGLQHAHRSFANAEMYFVRSCQYGKRKVAMGFPVASDKAFLIDTWTGKAVEVRADRKDDKAWINLFFTHYSSYLIAFGEVPGIEIDDNWFHSLQASVSGACLLDLVGGWSFTICSVMQGEEKSASRVNFNLCDWADDPELGLYTGWGVYERVFRLEEEPDSEFVLDLGIVGDIARVFINDTALGDLISLPYAVTVGHTLRKGENRIRIEVLNSLRNGMISTNRFQVHHERSMAGLIGPVRLLKLP